MKFVIMGFVTAILLNLVGLPTSGWRFWLVTIYVGAVAIAFEELARHRAEKNDYDAYQRGWKASEKYFQMMQRYKGAGDDC